MDAKKGFRQGERGQAAVLLAVMFTALIGICGLVITGGMGQMNKRLAQNATDAASLAAAYSFYTGDTSLTDATTLADNQVTAEGFTASQLILAFYNSSGQTTTTGSLVTSVGATLTDSSMVGFGKSAPTVVATATALVSGTGSGSGSSVNPQYACEICVFGDVTMNGSGDQLVSGGSNVDIGGYLFFDNSTDKVQTTNNYGIDIIGSTLYSGYSVYSNGANTIEASGDLGLDHNLYFNSTGNVVKTDSGLTADINLNGTLGPSSSNYTISPTTYGTAATPPFGDPLATTATPVSGSSVAPTYTGMTNYGASTDATRSNSSCSSSTENLSPGIYTSITVTCKNTTLDFASGLYVLAANGAVGLNIQAQGITLSGSAVQFYATCATGTAPSSCGTWNSTTDVCTSTKSGSEMEFNGSTALNLTGPSGSNSILFFFDRCNSNTNAFYVDSSGLTAASGFPTGMLYAQSGTLYMNASTSSLPTAIVVDNIYYNAGSITLGTTTGYVALPGAPSTSSVPMLSS